ncbi:MAG: hypothetical protein N3G75_06375 [Methanothrix sp.]|nr:hypothetical protein [Methanothrix sp.]
MSVAVTIRTRPELVDLADKMVKYGMARSRSHAFNLLLEEGMRVRQDEVRFWEELHENVNQMRRKGLKVEHGGLSALLEEGRDER